MKAVERVPRRAGHLGPPISLPIFNGIRTGRVWDFFERASKLDVPREEIYRQVGPWIMVHRMDYDLMARIREARAGTPNREPLQHG